jgi:hypothetical protein
MRGARYVRLISWTLQSGSEQVHVKYMLKKVIILPLLIFISPQIKSKERYLEICSKPRKVRYLHQQQV